MSFGGIRGRSMRWRGRGMSSMYSLPCVWIREGKLVWEVNGGRRGIGGRRRKREGDWGENTGLTFE